MAGLTRDQRAEREAAKAEAVVVEAAKVEVNEAAEAPVAAVVNKPVAPKGIDLAAIAKSLDAGFTAHENGGVFRKGTKNISLNVENYTDENHVKLALRHNGITG